MTIDSLTSRGRRMWRSLRRRIGSAAQVQSFRADCALRTTGDAFRTSAQNGTYGAAAPAAGPMRTEPLGRGLGQHAARGKPTSSVTAEVALPYNLPYKSRHLPSSAIVARLQQGRSGPVSPSRVIPSNPLYRFHTAEVGGSSPLAPTRCQKCSTSPVQGLLRVPDRSGTFVSCFRHSYLAPAARSRLGAHDVHQLLWHLGS